MPGPVAHNTPFGENVKYSISAPSIAGSGTSTGLVDGPRGTNRTNRARVVAQMLPSGAA